MAVVKREKPLVLTGENAEKFLSNKRKNEIKVKTYLSSNSYDAVIKEQLIEKERNYCSLVLDLMDMDLIQSYYEC